MAKSRALLDSSVLIAAVLSTRGGSHYILSRLHGDVDLLTIPYVMDEVHEVLLRKFPSRTNLWRGLFLLLGLSSIQIVQNPPSDSVLGWSEWINIEDAPILAAAAASECDFLVTLDKDFRHARTIAAAANHGMRIVSPGEFIAFLRNQDN